MNTNDSRVKKLSFTKKQIIIAVAVFSLLLAFGISLAAILLKKGESAAPSEKTNDGPGVVTDSENDDDPDSTEAKDQTPTSITLDKATIALTPSATQTLVATVYAEQTAIGAEINWKSSDDLVATVENGIVSAKKEGEAVITATTKNGLSASCNVIVTKLSESSGSESIMLDRISLILTVGSSEKVNASIQPASSQSKNVTWLSSNNSVVTVENGVVCAVGVGSATVTAILSEEVYAILYVIVSE